MKFTKLSSASFNALLKSIEEPPAHVIFMMATTELHKIPDTILSRSQVFEFRTIAPSAIVAHLRRIADAEQIEIPDEALHLLARAAEGSMRDAQSAFDQVIAFAGNTISVEDVSTVLGLVGRDLLFALLAAVVKEDGPEAFALADRAVVAGHDLRLVCRELSRVVRDMMILGVDPSRAGDGELAESERDQLSELGRHFSREDLLRAFDLLSRGEYEIRNAAHPRYYFEMLLLRWMHVRKLVPLAELFGGSSGSLPPASSASTGSTSGGGKALTPRRAAPAPRRAPAQSAAKQQLAPPAAAGRSLKDAILAEIRASKAFFYNTVVAQAQKIDVTDSGVVFVFLPTHQALRAQFDQGQGWLEDLVERVAGRRLSVTAVQSNASAAAADVAPEPSLQEARDLKAQALESSTVQAVLDVFPAEIGDVEEV